MIAIIIIVTIERQNGHQIEMRTMKRPEFIEQSIDTWIYLHEMSLYITLSLKCACIAVRRVVFGIL